MRTRVRKNHLILVLKARALGARMKPAEVAQFEIMYRRARSTEEQDQVTQALASFLDGWKVGDDDYSRLLRDACDLDSILGEDDWLPVGRLS